MHWHLPAARRPVLCGTLGVHSVLRASSGMNRVPASLLHESSHPNAGSRVDSEQPLLPASQAFLPGGCPGQLGSQSSFRVKTQPSDWNPKAFNNGCYVEAQLSPQLPHQSLRGPHSSTDTLGPQRWPPQSTVCAQQEWPPG